MYPFDTEICTLDLQVFGNDYRFTKLIPKELKYHGPQTLENYIIREVSKLNTKIDSLGKKVEMRLGRKISSIFLVTYLPTILMNVINQATNYFKSDDLFGDVITVNITCMMVLAALYISVSNSLYMTSSIKYVEIWLLFSLIYPFLIIMFQTWIHKCKMDKLSKVTPINQAPKNTWMHKLMNVETKITIGEIIAKYLIPGCGIIFSIVYFWIGLMQE